MEPKQKPSTHKKLCTPNQVCSGADHGPSFETRWIFDPSDCMLFLGFHFEIPEWKVSMAAPGKPATPICGKCKCILSQSNFGWFDIFWFPIPHHIPPTWPPKTSPWTTPRSWYPGCAWSYTSSSRRIFFGSMSSHHQAFYGITLGWRSSLGSLMLGGALHGWVATGLSHRKGQCFGVHVLGSNY